MAKIEDILKLRMPAQESRTLSFSGHSPKAFGAWVDALPIVNLGETARLLYNGIQELNQLNISCAQRFQLLDLLRPKIHYTCDLLSKHFDDQPLILSTKARKVANLCQALQQHLSLGYKICLLDSLQGSLFRSNAQFTRSSLHRCLTELVCIFLRYLKLYHPPNEQSWLELHCLYLLAEEQNLLDEPWEDSEIKAPKPLTIADLYKKIILLACAKPNQLTPTELDTIFYASHTWGPLVSISNQSGHGDLYGIKLNSDKPPLYIKDLDRPNQHTRYVNFKNLVNWLQTHCPNPDSATQDKSKPNTLTHTLSNHLVRVWSTTSKRANERKVVNKVLEIAIGLSATHYYLTKAYEAKHDLTGTKSKTTLLPDIIPKNQTIHYNATVTASFFPGENTQQQFTTYQCKTIDQSHHGFCLGWTGTIPAQVKNGELIAIYIKETESWHLGIIRWARHFKDEGLRTGVELLSANGQPVRAQVVKKTGTPSDFMRTLLLPANELGEAPTLITPKLTFKTGDKVVFDQFGNQSQGILERMRTSTNSFNEFQIKILGQSLQDNALNEPLTQQKHPVSGKNGNDNDELDSIWSSL